MKKSLTKLLARMARDGDVESLAEMITELTEAAEAPAPEAAAAAVQPAPTGIPAEEDPLVSAVMEAVENAAENAGTAGGAGMPGNAGAGKIAVIGIGKGLIVPHVGNLIVILAVLGQIVGHIGRHIEACGFQCRKMHPDTGDVADCAQIQSNDPGVITVDF